VKVTLVLMALLAIVTSLHVGMTLLAMQNKLLDTVREDVSVIADVADRLISTHLELLKTESKIVAEKLAGLPDAEVEDFLGRIIYLHKNFISLTVFNRDGVVASHGDFPAPNSLLQSSRYLPEAFAGRSIISSTFWDMGTGKLMMYVYVPIEKDRVLAVTIRGTFFSELLADIRLWKTGNIFMIDGQGLMLINMREHYVLDQMNFIELGKKEPIYRETGEFFSRMLQGKKGSGHYSHNGVVRLGVWKKVTGSTEGWTLGVAAPLNESPVGQAQLGTIFSGILFLAFGMLIVVLISGKVARPLQMIEEQNKDLTELNMEVKTANEAKSNFLANVSHEMRTPMSAIIGLSELMLGENEVHGEAREKLDKIYSAAMTLLNIINDLLDISKIESGKFELVSDVYDLPSFINDTVTLNIMRIAEKPIDFKLSIDKSLPSKLIGDDLRVKQVCNNLLSNAFKYTREGTVEWRISSEREGDFVWMTCVVKDTGIGIKPEDLSKLFSDYSQVDTKSNRRIEGTGLGLALARRMIEMMDGSIQVESEYGKGSTFTARYRQKFVSDETIGAEVVENLKNSNYSQNQLHTKARFVRVQLPYARVLVVDDVPTNLDVARGMLKPYGIKVDCVDGGQEAIDLIRKEEIKYSAIFMDHMMPEMDGVEAVRIIRSEIETDYAKNIPIIAMTANAIVGNEEMFLRNGFQAFIAKPIDIMLLDSVIRHWVRDKSMENGHDTRQTEAKEQNRQGPLAVPGLDLEECLERFGGDEDVLREVLGSYVRNTPVMLEKIRTVTHEDLDGYVVIAHGIKGSSQGICANDVGKLAEALEHAAKTGDFAFIEANNDAFLRAIEELISKISVFLSGTKI
jgi:signal transduction histidine kinase/CheY-like chemotaxis protein